MKNVIWIICLLAMAFPACKKEESRTKDSTYNPILSVSNFSKPTALTNTYFPYQSGKKYIFEGQTEDGFERIEVEYTNKSKTVLGIACAVIRDRVWIDGVLVEDTDDWYAQDNDGTVWYMGEYVTNYNPNGSIKDYDGAWEAGVDGAKPGIQMLADPKSGMKYRQEYYFNEAEDEAEVIEIGKKVSIPLGIYENCIVIKEWTELEPGQTGPKTYAPGIGLIRDGEKITLVKIE